MKIFSKGIQCTAFSIRKILSWISPSTDDWKAGAQACKWWITKWKVETLTDNKSSGPFWQESSKGRVVVGKENQEKEDMQDESDASWGQNALLTVKIKSPAVQVAISHMRADQAAACRSNTQWCGQTFNRLVLWPLPHEDWGHVFSCQSQSVLQHRN